MSVTWLLGDVRERLKTVPSRSVQLCVTSPPYFNLRGYQGTDNVIGNEATVEDYVYTLVLVFREVRRILHPTGSLYLNLGDSFARDAKKGRKHEGSTIDTWEKEGARAASTLGGMKPKDKMMVPHRVALALQADGWWLRSDMPWVKRSILPDSTKDRPTVANEYVFMLTPSERCYYDYVALKQTGSFKAAGNKKVHKLAGDTNPEAVRKVGTIHHTAQAHGVYEDRAFRTTDPFMMSLKWILDKGEDVLLDDEAEPIAMCVNTRPSKEKHFAVFPEVLVEPLIRGGTSEKGQCCECGNPWVRLVTNPSLPKVERERGPSERSGGVAVEDSLESRGMSHRAYDEWRKANPAATTGWKPSCECNAGEPVSQTVLDPFGGSGTTSVVAERLGRNSIYVDANEGYLAIAQRRLNGAPVIALPEPAEEKEEVDGASQKEDQGPTLPDFLARLRAS